jgi:hypothetical protein
MGLNNNNSVRELNIAISERNRKLFERYLLMPVLITAFIVSVVLSSQASFDYFGLLSSSHAAFLLGMGMNSMISEYFNIFILHLFFVISNAVSVCLFFYKKPKTIVYIYGSLKERLKIYSLRVAFYILGGGFLYSFFISVFEEPICGFRCYSPSFSTIYHNYIMHAYTFLSLQMGCVFLMMTFFCFPKSYRK